MIKEDIKQYLAEIENENFVYRLVLESIGNILYSIRLDFSNVKEMKLKTKAALCLIKSLPHNDNLEELKKSIKGFKPGKTDGRYFRANFPHGYIGITSDNYGN